MKKIFGKTSRAAKTGLRSSIKSGQSYYKSKILSRFFWGRSNLYKQVLHFFIFTVAILIALSGFTVAAYSNQSKNRSFSAEASTFGDLDQLEQGGNIETILLASTTANFQIINHKVKDGESYDDLAARYNVEVESIKLSNLDTIDYYQDDPPEGETLRIPDINGVLIKIDEDDTLDKIMDDLLNGSRLDVIEINNLRGPEYALDPGEFILVPDGRIDPPPKPVTATSPSASYSPYVPVSIPIPSPSEAVLRGVQFVDPLFGCGGYGYSRGFSSWHPGVDLTKGGGCWIRAAASGTVTYAGWANGGQGFMVRIDHGNGVQTEYFHGDGRFNVQAGQAVGQGDQIMYMGCTGFCTGTHLHLTMKLDGILIDPAPYVPYWRP